MEETLYTTGEFAQLCGVKKQTLFHYDQIGLLSPVRVDANGYRRYSYNQYEQYLLISCLKEAGMSLAEIKEYLELDDPDEKERIIKLRLAALDSRIEYLMKVRKIITSSFTGTGTTFGVRDTSQNEILLTDTDADRFLAYGPLDELDDKQLVEGVAELVKVADPRCVCLVANDVMQGVFDVQKLLLFDHDAPFSSEAKERLALFEHTKPAGQYAAVRQQPGETVEQAYLRLTEVFIQNEVDPGEYFYEEYTLSSDNPEPSPVAISVQLIPLG